MGGHMSCTPLSTSLQPGLRLSAAPESGEAGNCDPRQHPVPLQFPCKGGCGPGMAIREQGAGRSCLPCKGLRGSSWACSLSRSQSRAYSGTPASGHTCENTSCSGVPFMRVGAAGSPWTNICTAWVLGPGTGRPSLHPSGRGCYSDQAAEGDCLSLAPRDLALSGAHPHPTPVGRGAALC